MRTGKKNIFWWLTAIGKPIYDTLELLLLILLFVFFVIWRIFRSFGNSLYYLSKHAYFRKLKFDFSGFSLPVIDLSWIKRVKITWSKKRWYIPKINIWHWRQVRVNIGWLAILAGVLGLVTIFYILILRDLPAPTELVTRDQAISTKIYDRHGRLLYKIYKNENRSIVALDELPKNLVDATIAIEDSDFYEHNGISWRGIGRAIKRNVLNNQMEGGSTITQQLVKNALLTPEKTMTRKLKEMILAVRVELKYSKDEILTMYFNEVGYGGAAYGVEEASQLYFGKPASQLDLAEAALLAGLPAAPTTYSPFGANPELAIVRQHQVLTRMVDEGYISPILAEEAKSEKLQFASPQIEIEAPHFVMYVKDVLVKKYGEAMVNKGGLEVTTTLDLDVQNLAEEAVNKEIANLKQLHVNNAAVLVTKPQTGEILAMVGSKDYFDVANDGQVNVTTRPRQPGSSIKVITYALALENGFTPATVIDDSPIVYRIPGSPPYSPKNYDNRFHGRVTVRQALASSYNVPAVKTLSQFGVNNMIDQAEKMGITTWSDRSRYGLALTLGGGEVLMTDMVKVYGVLANGGERVDLNPIFSVSDYKGHVYERLSCPKLNAQLINKAFADEVIDCRGEEVVNPLVAYQLTDILSDNEARAPAFGRNSVLNVPGQPIAVKTGTSNNLRDNWTIGYTDKILTAVWVGNNDNSPMSYVASGITGASPIWRNIIEALLSDYPAEEFIKPNNLVPVIVCQLTGTRTCPACPNPKEEYFAQDTEPATSCNEEMIRSVLNPTPKETGKVDRILEGISTEQ